MKDFTKSVLKTVVAVAVLAGVGTYAYYGEFKKGKEEEKKKDEELKLFTFEKSRVASIDVIRNGQVISVVDRGGEWKIETPVKADADPKTVSSLIESMGNFKAVAVVDKNPADLSIYGLDRPQLQIMLKLRDQQGVGLSLGLQNQFDQSYYFKREGDTGVYQAKTNSKWGVDKDLFALRDKRIFLLRDEDRVFNKMVISMPEDSYTLEKTGEVWRLAFNSKGKTINERAEDEEVTKLTNAIRSVRAVGVAAEEAGDLKEWGFEPGRGSIRIWKGKDDTIEEVLIAKSTKDKKPVIHAKNAGSPVVFELAEQFYKDMDKDLFSLRYKKLLTFNRNDVRKVVIRFEDGVASLIKETLDAGEEWFFDEPDRPLGKFNKISAMISDFEGLKAMEFLGNSPAVLKQTGLTNPRRTITFFDGSGKELGRVDIGNETEKGVMVKGSNLSEVVLVDKKKLELYSDVGGLREDAPQAK